MELWVGVDCGSGLDNSGSQIDPAFNLQGYFPGSLEWVNARPVFKTGLTNVVAVIQGTKKGEIMLFDLNALIGTSVLATDGETGSVRNFLLDDQSWMIRYVVVDVGNWLKRHDVVLPTSMLERPDWASKTCHAHLSKEQIHNSPDVDAEMSVSRQQEIAMHHYFGALASWVDREFSTSPMPTGMTYPLHTAEVLHLRSALQMLGYHVWASDGDFGVLEGFVMDNATWHLGYLDVKSGNWLKNRSVLVPTRWVDSVSWSEFRINLHHTKSGTKERGWGGDGAPARVVEERMLPFTPAQSEQ